MKQAMDKVISFVLYPFEIGYICALHPMPLKDLNQRSERRALQQRALGQRPLPVVLVRPKGLFQPNSITRKFAPQFVSQSRTMLCEPPPVTQQLRRVATFIGVDEFAMPITHPDAVFDRTQFVDTFATACSTCSRTVRCRIDVTGHSCLCDTSRRLCTWTDRRRIAIWK